MKRATSLEEEYLEFLESKGLTLKNVSAPPEVVRQLITVIQQRDQIDGLRENSYDYLHGNLNERLNVELNHISDEMVSIVTAPPFDLEHTDSYTGVFPTGSFNAQARPCRGGSLLLLNQGFFWFISDFFSVLLRSSDLQAKLLTRRFHECWEKEQVIRSLVRVFTEYVCYGSVVPSKELSGAMFGGLIRVAQEQHVSQCAIFVLAHEHAHVALGHLGANRMMRSSLTPVGEVEFIAKSWEQEFAADELGHAIQLAFVEKRLVQAGLYDDDDIYSRLLQISVCSTSCFFLIDGLIGTIQQAIIKKLGITLPVITDHPPSHLRLAKLRSELPDEAVWEHARHFQELLQGITDRIVEGVLETFARDTA